jgi:hypothetical protein
MQSERNFSAPRPLRVRLSEELLWTDQIMRSTESRVTASDGEADTFHRCASWARAVRSILRARSSSARLFLTPRCRTAFNTPFQIYSDNEIKLNMRVLLSHF